MDSLTGKREGFALATAIVALVLVGALVTGGFYAAGQEGRVATSAEQADLALNVAEFGLHEAVGRWGQKRYGDIPVGEQSDTAFAMSVGGTDVGRANVEVRRLTDRLFFLTSRGEVLQGGRYARGRRALGMLVRTSEFDIDTDRAMTSLSPVEVGGSSKVSGIDIVNPAWEENDECSSTGPNTGIMARDEDLVNTKGNGSIVGEPAKDEDPTMTAEKLLDFGDWSYEDLVAMASKEVAAGATINSSRPTLTADGDCNEADPLNWGAPQNANHPCHFYFPIIHAKGDLNLNGNAAGQGILLVDGDLGIRGGYEFSGIIIVRGKIETGGGGSDVYGTVIVLGENTTGKSKIKDCDEDGCESKITGNPILNLSTCAVTRAIRYNEDLMRAFPIAERNWFDLSAVGYDVGA